MKDVVNYEHCPLCHNEHVDRLIKADCTVHKLYQSWMPPAMQWLRCGSCGHQFTEWHFTSHGLEKLFSQPALVTEQPMNRTSKDRMVASRLIERVLPFIPPNAAVGVGDVDWLDIGFGNGAIVATAEEYGFRASGIDARTSAVEQLKKQGYDARHARVMELCGMRKDVVSMLDVLEHTAFPMDILMHVRKEVIHRNGVLVLSCPNAASDEWYRLHNEGKNPYWYEIEHHHNFTRKRLYELLKDCGFRPVKYHVSERYLAGMEVIAVTA